MNPFSLFIKKRKWLLVIEGCSTFIAGVYFSASGKNDSSIHDLFWYIFLPPFVPWAIYMMLTSRRKKNRIKG
jgi:hypothetical protein